MLNPTHVSHMQRTSVGQPLCLWNSVSDVCTGFYWREGSTGTCWWQPGMGRESLCDMLFWNFTHSWCQRHTKCGHRRPVLTFAVQKAFCCVGYCFAIQSNPMDKTGIFRPIKCYWVYWESFRKMQRPLHLGKQRKLTCTIRWLEKIFCPISQSPLRRLRQGSQA